MTGLDFFWLCAGFALLIVAMGVCIRLALPRDM